MLADNHAQTARKDSLSALLQHPDIWRRGHAHLPVRSSGHAELDAILPGGGWPCGALTEILVEHDGLGEMSLLLPTLVALSQEQKRVAMVAPPYLPYPPALGAAGMDLRQLAHIEAGHNDSHWSAEQCLRSGCCAAVLHWMPNADYRQLRRLQLAAETGAALGFVFRPASARDQASPASLRLLISQDETGSCITLLKCKGSLAGTHPRLSLRAG